MTVIARRARRSEDTAAAPDPGIPVDVAAELARLRADVEFLAGCVAALTMPAGAHVPSVLVRSHQWPPGAAARFAALADAGGSHERLCHQQRVQRPRPGRGRAPRVRDALVRLPVPRARRHRLTPLREG